MQQLITIIHILVAICVIGLVLIQRGKGSDVGANFGGGASQTMFGSQGSTPFLVKLTGALALVFFITSSVLSFVIGKHAQQNNLFIAPATTTTTVPVQHNQGAVPPLSVMPSSTAPATTASSAVENPGVQKPK